MVQYSPGTWRDYVWVSAALAGFNLLLIIFFYPESNFSRPFLITSTSEQIEGSESKTANSYTEEHVGDTSYVGSGMAHSNSHGVHHVDCIKVSWSSIWFSFFKVDHQVSLLITAIRPLIVLIHPAVIWAVFVYGSSLAAQVTIM